MKAALEKLLKNKHPELAEGLHLPVFAVVTGIPDPPTGGETCRDARPHYAINCRLLTASMDYDQALPELLDVPVALPAGGSGRGLAGLPQPGAVVEVAFAYGRLTKPFVRSALPYQLPLPTIDAASMRWQQTNDSYQEVDAAGNWRRVAPDAITDVAAKLWIGSQSENLLMLVLAFMDSVVSGFTTLAGHTHPSVATITEGAAVTAAATSITGQRGRLAGITKDSI